MPQPLIKLHIANKNYSSWSLRPWLLLKGLNIAFEELFHPFSTGANASENTRALFLTFNPAGKVPALEFGDTVVWDSLAITEFLAERFAGVWPNDAKARAWGRCVVAEMHSGFFALRNTCPMNCGIRLELSEAARSADLLADIARIDEIWSQGLKFFGGPFLGGAQFSAIDAFFAPVAFRAQSYGLALSEPAARYRDTLLALPAMREWYMAALIETDSEPEHDLETIKVGRLTADLRRPPRLEVTPSVPK
jgi:glutathione S-transferase